MHHVFFLDCSTKKKSTRITRVLVLIDYVSVLFTPSYLPPKSTKKGGNWRIRRKRSGREKEGSVVATASQWPYLVWSKDVCVDYSNHVLRTSNRSHVAGPRSHWNSKHSLGPLFVKPTWLEREGGESSWKMERELIVYREVRKFHWIFLALISTIPCLLLLPVPLGVEYWKDGRRRKSFLLSFLYLSNRRPVKRDENELLCTVECNRDVLIVTKMSCTGFVGGSLR